MKIIICKHNHCDNYSRHMLGASVNDILLNSTKIAVFTPVELW